MWFYKKPGLCSAKLNDSTVYCWLVEYGCPLVETLRKWENELPSTPEFGCCFYSKLHIFPFIVLVQNCMLAVDKDQVWMGSEDSVIYIISMVAMVCNRQLTDHRSEVTGLALDTDKYRWTNAGNTIFFGERIMKKNRAWLLASTPTRKPIYPFECTSPNRSP